MDSLDSRLTPARADLAAAHLQGTHPAALQVEGRMFQVSVGVAPIRKSPQPDARQESQLLFGERFTVYHEADGWGFGQAFRDGYVGYVDMEALSLPARASTHSVSALRTYVFSEPDLKSPPRFLLSMGAAVTALAQIERYVEILRGGYVFAGHLRARGDWAGDWVAEAEKFLHAPYFWGGKESLGLDCSGLIQTAMHAAGMACPRDSDMQEHGLGEPIAVDLGALARGDLVFWPGHVGVMIDPRRLLHANAYHMAVAIEPVAEAAARIASAHAPIRSIRRLSALVPPPRQEANPGAR